MVLICGNLTDIISWFVCAESGVPFTEGIIIASFFIFVTLFKSWSLREALPASLLMSTIMAAGFLGLASAENVYLINPWMVVISALLTALSVVFLNSQNNPM